MHTGGMAGNPLRVPVGRLSERARLAHLLDDTERGRGGVLVVEGEAGTGKTTLARELREAADGRGFTTLWGACVHFASARIPMCRWSGRSRTGPTSGSRATRSSP
jgi:hypothetical protein